MSVSIQWMIGSHMVFWCFVFLFHGLVMSLFPSQALSRINICDWTGVTRCIWYNIFNTLLCGNGVLWLNITACFVWKHSIEILHYLKWQISICVADLYHNYKHSMVWNCTDFWCKCCIWLIEHQHHLFMYTWYLFCGTSDVLIMKGKQTCYVWIRQLYHTSLQRYTCWWVTWVI